MTSPNVDTFKYNGFGEMISATVGGVTTSYTYYANATRRTKTVSGETTVHMWDGDNIIADTDGDYAIKSSYVRGVRLAEYRNGNETQQYSYNRHGDVTELIDKVTGSSSAYDYDAYGNQNTESNTDLNPFRYSGEYYDAETGFIYLRARYYDPTIGRFTAEDPIRDGLNWYAYCNNNPVMYVDPSGKSFVDIIIIGTIIHQTIDVLADIFKEEATEQTAVYKPSKEVLDFIKSYEKLELTSYDASGKGNKGDWTIGYGHKLFEFDGNEKNPNIKWTKEKAESVFREDVEKMVNTTFVPFLKANNIKLNQQQFDAMLSFTFNFDAYVWGGNNSPTIQNFIRNGDYSEKATKKAFAMYMGSKASDGHIARRNDEIEMFLFGDYKRDYNYERPDPKDIPKVP